MAVTKAKKVTLLTNLSEVVKGALSLVFVSFTGLTVHEANELRAGLKKEGVRYVVAKKTLLHKALKDAGIEGDEPTLDGQVALAYYPKGQTDDATTTARSLNEFVKKFSGKGGTASGQNKLTFLGGVTAGRFVSREDTVTIASIPPLQVLRGMFVNIINSPRQRFALALGEVAKKK